MQLSEESIKKVGDLAAHLANVADPEQLGMIVILLRGNEPHVLYLGGGEARPVLEAVLADLGRSALS